MIRSITISAVLCCGVVAPLVHAEPADDLKEFRAYFSKKFPSVKFDDYSRGFVVLPDMEEYQLQWDVVNDFPPQVITVQEGKTLWETPMANGKTFSSCFRNGGVNIAQNYPYWHEASQKVRTAEMDLLDCMNRNDPVLAQEFSKFERTENRVRFAGLVGHFYSLSAGQRVNIDLSSPGARAAYEAGKKFWWQKRGQLNFSCGDCHWQIAGKNIGGNQPLSAALGHPLGWPGYRGSWQRLDLIHTRYRTCNSQVRAKPFAYISEVYNNLQLYETFLSSGLPLTAPSYRGY